MKVTSKIENYFNKIIFIFNIIVIIPLMFHEFELSKIMLSIISVFYILDIMKKIYVLKKINALVCIDFILLLTLWSNFKIIQLLRIIRIFKVTMHNKHFTILIDIIIKKKMILNSALQIALIYIFISAVIVYNLEPDTFKNIWSALYWSSVTLTTVGYGDIYPVSAVGKFFTVISSIIGIGVIAIPTGIIAGEFSRVNNQSE